MRWKICQTCGTTDQIEITIPAKIFEAAAVGKPIIVSAVGASADLVQRYYAGLVVPPEQSASLAAAILDLRNAPELQARLREGALRLARDYDRQGFAGDMLHDDERNAFSREARIEQPRNIGMLQAR